jgi:hypothetical protein
MKLSTSIMINVAFFCFFAIVFLDPRVARNFGLFLQAWADGLEWLTRKSRVLRAEIWRHLALFREGVWERMRELQQERTGEATR